jgi:hypothetical protein
VGLYTKDVEELLVATMAHESKGGTYVGQVGGDSRSALGIFQMEPFTYDNLWGHYLSNNAALSASILNSMRYLQKPPSEHLIFNNRLSIVMARVFYLQLRDAIPERDDLDGIWSIYKTYYNSSKGAATKDEFVADYFRFIGKENPNEKVRKEVGKKSGT